MGSQPNWLVVRFQEFCRSTALHGWSYLIKVRFFFENQTIIQTKKKTLSLKTKQIEKLQSKALNYIIIFNG
jgi:hypothetical protein